MHLHNKNQSVILLKEIITVYSENRENPLGTLHMQYADSIFECENRIHTVYSALEGYMDMVK
jgi:hypothetical protein